MFRQIPIEISIGCFVILITPIIINENGLPMIEIINGKVEKTVETNFNKWFFVSTPNHNNIKMPEWRIVRYTYGGIWMENPKFDQKRIDGQNKRIVRSKQKP